VRASMADQLSKLQVVQLARVALGQADSETNVVKLTNS
jgi:hypothetical protein